VTDKVLHTLRNTQELGNMGKNWKNRERKQRKSKTGMKISGRSVLTIQEIQRKRAEKIRDEKKRK
jgi:hypothetical protein